MKLQKWVHKSGLFTMWYIKCNLPYMNKKLHNSHYKIAIRNKYNLHYYAILNHICIICSKKNQDNYIFCIYKSFSNALDFCCAHHQK